MLCLRCRALPSIRAPLSNTRTPMNRLSQFTPQASLTANIPSSRLFSSLLSTPARLQPPQTLAPRVPSSTSTPTIPSISSLLAQQPQVQQTRSFSATPALGVRRVTFRPSRRVQKRRHGFLARNNARKGRLTLTRRRLKGRKVMSW